MTPEFVLGIPSSGVTATGAKISVTFTGPDLTQDSAPLIYYSTTNDILTAVAVPAAILPGNPTETYTAILDGLSPGTTYYYWAEYWGSPKQGTAFTTSFIYEDICKELFLKLCDENVIDFAPQTIGSYRSQSGSIEIDVIAVNHDTKQLFAGECKYYTETKLIASGLYQELKNKCQNPDLKDYQIMYGLFSPTGFEHELVETAKSQQELILIKEMKRI